MYDDGSMHAHLLRVRRRCPKLQTHTQDLPPPADVDAYPLGAAESGAMDLCGNVWQYTDEFMDEHSRAVVLRGGSRWMAAMLGSRCALTQNIH